MDRSFNFDLHSTLQNDLDGKTVLYIPMYSMRSYDTGFYDLAKDGNVNRFLSKLSRCEYVELTITVPFNVTNLDFLHQYLNLLVKRGNLENYEIIQCSAYKHNALETRNSPEWEQFLYTTIIGSPFDLILYEPNIIGGLIDSSNAIYWCPVSVDPFKESDTDMSKKFKTYVASKNQLHHMPNAILDNDFFNPEIFVDETKLYEIELNDTVIFNPFRQSDKGYKIQYIYEALEQFQYTHNFILLYTAPNDFEHEIYTNKLKVSGDRVTYYSILKSRPIVIYLENPDEILHAGLLEFIHFGCRLVYMKNNTFHHVRHEGELNELSAFELQSAIIGVSHDLP